MASHKKRFFKCVKACYNEPRKLLGGDVLMLFIEKRLRNSSIVVTIVLVISLLIFFKYSSFKAYQTNKIFSYIEKEDIVFLDSLRNLTHLPYE